jgi:hypothetical protein
LLFQQWMIRRSQSGFRLCPRKSASAREIANQASFQYPGCFCWGHLWLHHRARRCSSLPNLIPSNLLRHADYRQWGLLTSKVWFKIRDPRRNVASNKRGLK